MSRGSTWANSDGLTVGFGTHSADNNVSSVYCSANGLVTVQAEYVLADLADTFAATNVNPQDHRIPRGSVIKDAYVHTLVAPTSSGSNATLDIGLWGVGITTEVVDIADGLVADATQAELATLGEMIQLDGAYIADAPTGVGSGTSVGATSNSDCVLAPSFETTAFTAGKIRVIVNYYPPSGSVGRTLAV